MNRIPEIIAALPKYDIDAMLLTGAVNRRWATGFPSSAGVLVVTPTESVFVIDSRYVENAKAQITGARVIEIETNKPYTEIINKVLEENKVQTLGFEDSVMTQAAYAEYQKKLKAELIPAGELMDILRQSKNEMELSCIKKAQEITDKAFAQAIERITPGMTEKELAAEIVYHLLKNGGEKTSFDPIVISGSRSSVPHGTPGDYPLSGFVVIDFGAVYRGYCSDMTRTIAVGTVTDEMRRVYDTVLEAQLAGCRAAKAGIVGRDLDQVARSVIEAAGYGAYFKHGLGHSLGLEVHESLRAAPTENRVLPAGTVVSIEPGIYLPGQFGVRIEDLVYLTETGAENLTKSPKELIVL